MAFSFRKILSNINYFKKPDEDEDGCDIAAKKRRHSPSKPGEPSVSISFEKTEPDSTSKVCSTSLNANNQEVKQFTAKKGSLSDTDLSNDQVNGKKKHRNKKLKLDIRKANKSMSEALDIASKEEVVNTENTPKHISLGCKTTEIFSERLKEFDFSKSFDIFEAISDGLLDEDDGNFDIKSLSEHSDSDLSEISAENEENTIKMCRKVEPAVSLFSLNDANLMQRSTTPESFGDVEIDKTEEERMTLLLSYQIKLEKMERFLKKLLSDFQFHIEVSKVFNSKSIVTTLPGSDVANLPKILGEITHMDNISRGPSPAGSWNFIMEKEDISTKYKLRNQLLSMKRFIEEFVNVYLQNQEPFEHEETTPEVIAKTRNFLNQRSITFNVKKDRNEKKRLRVHSKKKNRRYNDYPDLKEALQNLFALETDELNDSSVSGNNVTNLISNFDESPCTCQCRYHHGSSTNISQTDSGNVNTGEEASLTGHSITSSIGNFSLDSSTLTAFSESLDQIVSYNSFSDMSLFSTLLQKAAIERITFYVQVHSIQLKAENSECDFESKNVIIFFCPSCKHTEKEEHGLLKHILEQSHCERIHFVYKTAYIKKCLSSGKEIQPSTVLNPMTMYRDENKIVCFGDAMYACSLCFENLIVGESVLMAHCADPDHVERREKLTEILE